MEKITRILKVEGKFCGKIEKYEFDGKHNYCITLKDSITNRGITHQALDSKEQINAKIAEFINKLWDQGFTLINILGECHREID